MLKKLYRFLTAFGMTLSTYMGKRAASPPALIDPRIVIPNAVRNLF